MKDRIKKVMESLHMTQQVFAEYIDISPAALSSIFTGRTRPTLATVEAIKTKMPTISTDWLMFGKEPMYLDDTAEAKKDQAPAAEAPTLFSEPPHPAATRPAQPDQPTLQFASSPEPTPRQASYGQVKYFDKPQRHITEIRIFYDDQTWETFVPKK